MQNGTMPVKALMQQVAQGQLRLPEIQRAYVWKPAQIAELIDSLYRGYPSGSLLLWRTDEQIINRGLSTTDPSQPGLGAPTYLLDGQQRITSLHRVYSGHPRARVVFNPSTERFQVASAATDRDARWVSVHELLAGSVDTFELAQALAASDDGLTPNVAFDRLNRVRKIEDYLYWLEILDDLPYAEVTQIFVRVNSRGRRLKETDLALATLSARWPGAVAKVDSAVTWCKEQGYDGLDDAFVVRALAALAVENTSPGGFASVAIEELESAWARLERGLRHTVGLLTEELGLDNSKLIPSDNALVPLVYWLGTRPDQPLGVEERNALLYWLLVALMESRYGRSGATVIAQDVAALRSSDPLRNLLRGLGLMTSRPVVSAERLAGKGSTSAFFLLSYLAAKRAGAQDWWYGVPIRLTHGATYNVEYHHVHPQARLKETYTKAEINDLANLVFISDKANRKIGARPMATYLADPEFDSSVLAAHFVPSDPALRSVEAYPEFVKERRQLLAEAISALLDHYRPTFLDEASSGTADPTECFLTFQAYGDPTRPADLIIRYEAAAGPARAVGTLLAFDLELAIDEAADGKGAEVEVDGQPVAIPAVDDELALPLGPLLVVGTIADWREVIAREEQEALPAESQPGDPPVAAWSGERLVFPVTDSE